MKLKYGQENYEFDWVKLFDDSIQKRNLKYDRRMTQTTLSGKVTSIWYEYKDLDMGNKFWACYYNKLSSREIDFKNNPPIWLKKAI
eukprot:Pgem_evm1s11730